MQKLTKRPTEEPRECGMDPYTYGHLKYKATLTWKGKIIAFSGYGARSTEYPHGGKWILSVPHSKHKIKSGWFVDTNKKGKRLSYSAWG